MLFVRSGLALIRGRGKSMDRHWIAQEVPDPNPNPSGCGTVCAIRPEAAPIARVGTEPICRAGSWIGIGSRFRKLSLGSELGLLRVATVTVRSGLGLGLD